MMRRNARPVLAAELVKSGGGPWQTRRPLTRRAVVSASVAAALSPWRGTRAAQDGLPLFSYPVGLAGRPLGDGFIVRHGYATENTWFNPGWWHTGEDWYLTGGAETGGVGVFAAAAGEVVFAGSEYPGLVAIVAHGGGLFSMYGHLDYAPAIEPGQMVARGQLLGTVLARTDDLAPSHLHFETRTFVTTPEVNGEAPRYGVACGFDCPPGPGYWPIDAPEHPSAMGWRNPTHVIAHRAWPDGVPSGTEVIVAHGAAEPIALWTAPPGVAGAEPFANLSAIAPGAAFPLLEIAAGPEDDTGTSADAYRLCYRIAARDDLDGWVQAALPSDNDTGSDGRPSSVLFNFLPAVVTN
jgi:murein DD-endopeptidase MepM/ murein hydrolase activator NlpD